MALYSKAHNEAAHGQSSFDEGTCRCSDPMVPCVMHVKPCEQRFSIDLEKECPRGHPLRGADEAIALLTTLKEDQIGKKREATACPNAILTLMQRRGVERFTLNPFKTPVLDE